MENVMKVPKGVRALAILVLLLVMPAGEVAFGHGTYRYAGYYVPNCVGDPYLETNDMDAIDREAGAGGLRSFKSNGKVCYNT